MEQAGQAEAGIIGAIKDMSRDSGDGTSSLNFALTDGNVLFVLRKAFINDGKYPMHFARLENLGSVGGSQVLQDHEASTATVVSSEPFTPGEWTSMEMGEMLIVTSAGHRVVNV